MGIPLPKKCLISMCCPIPKSPFSPRIYGESSGKIAYFHAPKCASRTILGWFALAKYPKLLEENKEIFDPFLLGDYPKISTITPEISLLEIGHRERFCVVRDPIDRFISAYSDRVLRYRREEFGAFPTISHLIANLFHLEDFPVLAHHIRPMCSFYGRELDQYTRIFSFNNLEGVKKYLEEGLQVSLPTIRLQSCEKINKPTISSTEREMLEGYYAEDLDIYSDFF